jgi:haloacetate dehalogenase
MVHSAKTIAKPQGKIPGFTRRKLPGEGIEIDALVGGSGPPLLLLHGFPETRMMWATIAPHLAQHFTLVMPDLRGYGRSDKPAGDRRHMVYAKRTMARDQIGTMRALGFDRFSVAGHDRGGRVAYRLALDHPERVERVALLDIVPTGDMWSKGLARKMRAVHWFEMAKPAPEPEAVIGRDPKRFVRWTLKQWAGADFSFAREAVDDYADCFDDAETIHAVCNEYRAGATRDWEIDEASRGREVIDSPTLVLWPKEKGIAFTDPMRTWRGWARDVSGASFDTGHFIAEEAPRQTAQTLQAFFGS